MKESELTKKILLALLGTGEVLLLRNNIGSGLLMRSRDMNRTPREVGARYADYGHGNPGGADWEGIYKGRAIYVEIKTPTGRQSSAQKAFQALVQRHGGIYRILRSVEDAQAFLLELRSLPALGAA